MTDDASKLTLNAPMYLALLKPEGFLEHEPACHGLWYYYMLATKARRDEAGNVVVMEGEVDPTYNYSQLFTSIAFLYGVEPEEMCRYWANIDMQCHIMDFPKLPDEERYRHNRPLVIASH